MKKLVCGSYIPGGLSRESAEKIDFKKITHVFVAFSTLRKEGEFYLPCVSDEVKNGIRLIHDEIEKQSASTLVLLSIGGACADFFCEASRSEENRAGFARRCAQMAQELSLDGIDMDWEFPGLPHGGISACEHCVHDFTLLCKSIREAVGDRLLTAAMGSDHWNRLENAELNELLDLVNIMTYDMNNTAHSCMTLTVSAMGGWAKNGIDREKLVLGIPFYARCEDPAYEWRGYDGLMQMVQNGEAQLRCGDEQDYIVIDGKKLSIDTPDSIRRKTAYVKANGFAGIFNWQELTDRDGELRNAMAEILE